MVNNTNNKNHKKELVAKCDQSKEVVANSCLDKRPVGPSGDHPEEVVANSCLDKRPVGPSGDHPEEVVANCDHLRSLKFYPSLPYAYTEQGIGQLSSVVHSKIAIERSINEDGGVARNCIAIIEVTAMRSSKQKS